MDPVLGGPFSHRRKASVQETLWMPCVTLSAFKKPRSSKTISVCYPFPMFSMILSMVMRTNFKLSDHCKNRGLVASRYCPQCVPYQHVAEIYAPAICYGQVLGYQEDCSIILDQPLPFLLIKNWRLIKFETYITVFLGLHEFHLG